MSPNSDDWMKDPAVSGIDLARLRMLQSLAEQGQGKSQAELLSFLLAAQSGSRQNQTRFSQKETEQIIAALKSGKKPEEAARIDQMVQMIRSLRH